MGDRQCGIERLGELPSDVRVGINWWLQAVDINVSRPPILLHSRSVAGSCRNARMKVSWLPRRKIISRPCEQVISRSSTSRDAGPRSI